MHVYIGQFIFLGRRCHNAVVPEKERKIEEDFGFIIS